MLWPRLLSFGAISVALSLSLVSVACGSAGAENASPSDSATNRPDRSGDGGSDGLTDTPVAALALSSCIPAGYTLPLSIGDSVPFDVTLDTGSTSIGVASMSCSGCDVQPKFSPEGSAIDQGVKAKSQYVTGGWSGEIYEGDISLDARTKASVKFVAIEQHQNFFIPQACVSKSGAVQGIIGLGPATGAIDGTNGFFDQFVAESKTRDLFATELCDEGGTLWFGGYDSKHATGAPQYTPLLRGSYTYYGVDLASIDVDGTTVPVASTKFPRTVVDTGASVFLLARSAFTPLTKAIAANSKFKALVGEDAPWFDNPDGRSCKKLTATKRELDASLPPLTLSFGIGPDAIAIRAAPTESYLGMYDDQWCSTLVTFDPTEDFRIASIMGAPVMRSNIVIFDRENRRIGFAPHAPCQ